MKVWKLILSAFLLVTIAAPAVDAKPMVYVSLDAGSGTCVWADPLEFPDPAWVEDEACPWAPPPDEPPLANGLAVQADRMPVDLTVGLAGPDGKDIVCYRVGTSGADDCTRLCHLVVDYCDPLIHARRS